MKRVIKLAVKQYYEIDPWCKLDPLKCVAKNSRFSLLSPGANHTIKAKCKLPHVFPKARPFHRKVKKRASLPK